MSFVTTKVTPEILSYLVDVEDYVEDYVERCKEDLSLFTTVKLEKGLFGSNEVRSLDKDKILYKGLGYCYPFELRVYTNQDFMRLKEIILLGSVNSEINLDPNHAQIYLQVTSDKFKAKFEKVKAEQRV